MADADVLIVVVKLSDKPSERQAQLDVINDLIIQLVGGEDNEGSNEGEDNL